MSREVCGKCFELVDDSGCSCPVVSKKRHKLTCKVMQGGDFPFYEESDCDCGKMSEEISTDELIKALNSFDLKSYLLTDYADRLEKLQAENERLTKQLSKATEALKKIRYRTLNLNPRTIAEETLKEIEEE